MKQKFNVTGMTCSACSAHVEKAVRQVEGVDSVSVNLLGNSMLVEYGGKTGPEQIIQAVTDAGYGASLPGPAGKAAPAARPAGAMEEELAGMKRRFLTSLVFLAPLFYIAMGHMMGWPLPAFFHQPSNALVVAFLQFLLTLPILYINRKYYTVGFKTLWHCAPNMDSLIAWAPPPRCSTAWRPCSSSPGTWAGRPMARATRPPSWPRWNTGPWISTLSPRA